MRNKLLKRRLFMRERRRKMKRNAQGVSGNNCQLSTSHNEQKKYLRAVVKDNEKSITSYSHSIGGNDSVVHGHETQRCKLNLEKYFEESIDEISSGNKTVEKPLNRVPVVLSSSFIIPFSPMRRPTSFSCGKNKNSHRFPSPCIIESKNMSRTFVTPTQA